MRESGNGIFGTKVFFNVVLPGLLLLALMVSFPAFATAGDAADGDAKIQAMRSDIMACMQQGAAGQMAREAFAKKYNMPVSKVNENVPARPPASNGGWDYNTSMFVCTLEIVGTSGVGAIIWGQRRGMDQYLSDSEMGYCVSYTQNCDHYKWQQGCLKQHVPSCCK
jgi:hypothetical protein